MLQPLPTKFACAGVALAVPGIESTSSRPTNGRTRFTGTLLLGTRLERAELVGDQRSASVGLTGADPCGPTRYLSSGSSRSSTPKRALWGGLFGSLRARTRSPRGHAHARGPPPTLTRLPSDCRIGFRVGTW